MSHRTLVVGGYGYRNVGDEAMLGGLLTQLDRSRVTVVSRDPAATRALHEIEATSIAKAVPALAAHRTVLIGGGSLFGRDMGRIGRLLPAFGLVAHALGRRVELVGIGLDDVNRNAWMVRALVRRAARVVVRDERSLELARSWGARTELAPDLSVALPEPDAATGEKLLRAAGVDLRRPVVGLCLTGIDPELAERVRAAVARAMEALSQVEFVFVPMARHPRIAAHDDLALAAMLRHEWPGLRVLDGVDDPRLVLAVFRRLDAAVCMRFHSLVFAERASVPMVPIAYASKCTTWLAERGMAGIEPTSEALTAALLDLIPAQRRAG